MAPRLPVEIKGGPLERIGDAGSRVAEVVSERVARLTMGFRPPEAVAANPFGDVYLGPEFDITTTDSASAAQYQTVLGVVEKVEGRPTFLEGLNLYFEDHPVITAVFAFGALLLFRIGAEKLGIDVEGAEKMPFELPYIILMGKRNREKKARREAAASAAATGADGASGRGNEPKPKTYSTIHKHWVELREDGVVINSAYVPYLRVYIDILEQMKDGLNHNDAASKINKKHLDMLEAAGDDARILKYVLLMSGINPQLFETMMGRTSSAQFFDYQLLTRFVDREFNALYPNAPALPVEYGPWTEFYEIYQQYLNGECSVGYFTDYLIMYAEGLRDKFRFLEDGVKLGPVYLKYEDFLNMGRKFATEVVEADTPAVRVKVPRKKLEGYLSNLRTNKNYLDFLNRQDISEEVKIKFTVLFYVGGRTIGLVMLHDMETGKYVTMPAAAAAENINKAYDKNVLSRMEGRYVEASAELVRTRPLEDVTVQFNVIPAALLGDGMMSVVERPDPSLSYTIFKKFEDALRSGCACLKTILEKNAGRETHAQLGYLRSIMAFLKDDGFGGLEASLRSDVELAKRMCMDLIMNFAAQDFEVYEKVYKVIESNRKNPRQFATQTKQLYVKYIYYARQLLDKIEAEEAQRSEPVAVVGRFLRKMEGEPLDVINAWERAQNRVLKELRDKLADMMKLAMLYDSSDVDLYRPWFIWLGSLGREVSDWQWLAELPDGCATVDVVRFLQKKIYPVGYSGDVSRSNLAVLGGDWKNFAQATAYMTNKEWKAFFAARAALSERTIKVLGSLTGKTELERAYEDVRNASQLLQNGGFSSIVNFGLTRLLNGEFGEDVAYATRDIIAEAATDADIFLSLLELAKYARDTETSADAERLVAVSKAVDELKQGGVVSGNILGLAVRISFANNKGDWFGAKAEYDAIADYVRQGRRVKILSPEPFAKSKMPDIIVYKPSGEGVVVEVKSRVWRHVIEEFDNIIRPALFEAAEQLQAKIVKGELNKGTLVLYLVGSVENRDEVCNRIRKLTADPLYKSYFNGVKVVVRFVFSFEDNWSVTEER